jgi:ssDNA-binding Zn-finger/Zn-ribbon topoisomerase 1
MNGRVIDNRKKCPRCDELLFLKDGKYGPFYGCSHYPECQYTEAVIASVRPKKQREEKRAPYPRCEVPGCNRITRRDGKRCRSHRVVIRTLLPEPPPREPVANSDFSEALSRPRIPEGVTVQTGPMRWEKNIGEPDEDTPWR